MHSPTVDPTREAYRGFLIVSEPFRHDDGTYSTHASVHREGSFIISYARSNIEGSFCGRAAALEAGITHARHWLDIHVDVWREWPPSRWQ